MTHEMSRERLEYLSRYAGRIDIEDIGEGDIVAIVIRIPIGQAYAEDIYHELGNIEGDLNDS